MRQKRGRKNGKEGKSHFYICYLCYKYPSYFLFSVHLLRFRTLFLYFYFNKNKFLFLQEDQVKQDKVNVSNSFKPAKIT